MQTMRMLPPPAINDLVTEHTETAMASLVGVFAASHVPLIARDWHTMTEALRRQISASCTEVGRRFEAARPDLLIEISPDHWANFFIDNYPTICVGVGETHEGPP